MAKLTPYEMGTTIDGYDSFTRIYPTGKCKKKISSFSTGESFTGEYIQCRRYFLGIPLWNYWVNKDSISWHEEPDVEVEYYDCKETYK